MKSRILTAYPRSQFRQGNASVFYIADFTERTESLRKVEIHETIPQTPDRFQNMDCLTVNNPHTLTIEFNVFEDNQFKEEEGRDIQHCECCLFPAANDDISWVAFVEIKDCKPKNIADYKEKVKEQIISTVQLFRNAHITTGQQKIYGIISFPRKRKTGFNETIFTDYTEYKRLYTEYHIHFYPTNTVQIKNGEILELIKT